MNKLTKIVATIGPSTDSPEIIEKLIRQGVNIFRFNFKHSSIEWHNERIERVNAVAKQLDMPVGTLIDLQGPELRIVMKGDSVTMEKGEHLLLGPDAVTGDEKGFSITHPNIIEHLKDGQKMVADDGAFTFKVQWENNKCYLVTETTGELLKNKSINIPGADFPFPVLVDRDLEGLQLAAKGEIDFVALSFVRSREDVETLRDEMKKYDLRAKIVAKIETKRALDNIDEIINASDAIMVARGDLGVELPIEEVPYYQKVIIKKCVERGIPVITATQMLQSMTHAPYPTRAEVSDVANAVYDLTDAVMLSGETASGEYPLETVEMMEKTIRFNEKKFKIDSRNILAYTALDPESMICDSAYNVYRQMVGQEKKVKGFVVFTQSGRTVRLLSRYRPDAPIYAFTPTQKTADSLTISFAVHPYLQETHHENAVTTAQVREAIDFLKGKELLTSGDVIIVLHGDKWALEGGTSTVRLAVVE